MQPGSLMAREIAEQPAVIERLVNDAHRMDSHVRLVGAELRAVAPRMVLLAARGTSDHAALYAKYLLEITHGLPCGLVSPSAYTLYDARPDLAGVLLIAVSQSGASPDLVGTMTRAREFGAHTLAVTNDAESPLASTAHAHLSVRAGVEEAVAATKSYSAELMTLWLLTMLWRDSPISAADDLPMAMTRAVARRDEVAALSSRYRFTDRILTTGRGYAYPTAREAALKLMETSYVAAHAFSGADLLHGPLAMVDEEHPVIAVVPDGQGATAMAPALDRLQARGADVLLLGGRQMLSTEEAAFASTWYELEQVREDLAPIVDIVTLQWLALEMAVERGFDPDQPRGLSKVTKTR